MIDLSRLTEDLRAYDATMGLTRKRYPELDHVQPTPVIVEAARLVVDGQDVRWCETHRDNVNTKTSIKWSRCRAARQIGEYDTCRIVPARLVFPNPSDYQGADHE